MIRFDQGGLIRDKAVEVEAARRSGTVVRIDGLCASACTLHVSNPKACATPRAVLAFHAASNGSGTRYLWKMYPEKVRAFIAARGGLSWRLILATGKEAQDLIGACDS